MNTRKILIWTGLLVIMVIYFYQPVLADDTQGRFSVGLNIGAVVPSEDELSSEVALGVQLGYGFSPYFETRLSYGHVESDLTAPPDGELAKLKMSNVGLSAVVKFMPEKKIVPYLGAGIGYYFLDLGKTDSKFINNVKDRMEAAGFEDVDKDEIFVNRSVDNTFSYHALGGVEIFFLDRISLQVEGKYVWADPDISVTTTFREERLDNIKNLDVDHFQVLVRFLLYF